MFRHFGKLVGARQRRAAFPARQCWSRFSNIICNRKGVLVICTQLSKQSKETGAEEIHDVENPFCNVHPDCSTDLLKDLFFPFAIYKQLSTGEDIFRLSSLFVDISWAKFVSCDKHVIRRKHVLVCFPVSSLTELLYSAVHTKSLRSLTLTHWWSHFWQS